VNIVEYQPPWREDYGEKRDIRAGEVRLDFGHLAAQVEQDLHVAGRERQ
jgi:hypothetical protein